MHDILKVIILAIVEGITEFLPISSTGHLILVNEFVQLSPESFSNAFSIIIQLGAILAVVKRYFTKLNPFSLKKIETYTDTENYDILSFSDKVKFLIKNAHKPTLRLWAKVVIACIPMVIPLLFDDFIDKYLFSPLVVAVALIFWGIVIILIEKRKDFKITAPNLGSLKPLQAFKIGLFQCLAMIPGTSRSAATIIGGMLLGANRTVAAEFSFFLAIPTMVGATLVKVLKAGFGFTGAQWGLILLGSLISFFVADMVIKVFMKYIKQNSFTAFGYYRIILGLLVLGYIYLK